MLIGVRAFAAAGKVRPFRWTAELKEASTHFELAAALCAAPAQKTALAGKAALCRSLAAHPWQRQIESQMMAAAM